MRNSNKENSDSPELDLHDLPAFGISLGSVYYIWHHYGHQRIVLEHLGDTLCSPPLAYEADFGGQVSLWGHIGTIWGQIWHSFVIALMPCCALWGRFGITLGSEQPTWRIGARAPDNRNFAHGRTGKNDTRGSEQDIPEDQEGTIR